MRQAWMMAVLLCSSMVLASIAVAEPQVELLWPKGAPDAKGTEPKDKPTLILYPAEKPNGAAIVVCPGGGYGALAMGHEGHDIAKWLNSFGVSAFILDYRHRNKGYGHPAPLQDAQRAIRTVRHRAASFGVDPKRVGILGFSAGGHLASSAGTHYDAGRSDAEDPIDRVSCRPDFLVLCYAVIALGEPYTHQGSQRNLLGADAPAELVKSMSNEKQVTSDTPPTFLWHTTQDTGVPPENSVYFYLALRRAKVPAEMHIFEVGRHGVGLGADIPGTQQWPKLCEQWLANRGLLKGVEK